MHLDSISMWSNTFVCLIWIWELSLRCLSVSTMTKWHHFDISSDPEPHNLNRTCLRCTDLLKPLALSGIVGIGIERPASSLAHTAVLGRMAFLRGSFLRASLLRVLPRHAIANCLMLQLPWPSWLWLSHGLSWQTVDALQGISHGPWGFGDCAVRKAVLVPPRRWEWSQDNTS